MQAARECRNTGCEVWDAHEEEEVVDRELDDFWTGGMFFCTTCRRPNDKCAGDGMCVDEKNMCRPKGARRNKLIRGAQQRRAPNVQRKTFIWSDEEPILKTEYGVRL